MTKVLFGGDQVSNASTVDLPWSGVLVLAEG
jgi:hypothetical protein